VKTIIIIAECYQGVMNAGWFVLRHLYHDRARIVLLQTFRMPSLADQLPEPADGNDDGIVKLLKRIGERELWEFKERLVNECGFSSDTIETVVEEGDLSGVIRAKFGAPGNLFLMIGSAGRDAGYEMPCRNVFLSLMETGVRPIFLIAGDIVMAGEGRIMVFPLHRDRLPETFNGFLQELAENHRCTVETVTHDRMFMERFLEAEFKGE